MSIPRIVRMLPIMAVILFFVPFSIQAEPVETKKEEFVAKVNGSGISQKDFDWALASAEKQFASIGAAAGQVNVKKEALDSLIRMELMIQDARKRNITVDEVAMLSSLEGFMAQFNEEFSFNDFLAQNDLTEEKMKDQLRRQLILQKLQQELAKEFSANGTVSDEEIKKFYDDNLDKFKRPEQVKASHILISVPEGADEAAKKEALTKIEGIQKKVLAGDDFAELARSNSQCPSSAQGGDLGFFGKGQMVKEFEDVAFALKPGEASGVVETPFGYHVIKLNEKRDAGTVPLEEVKGRIEEYLSQLRIDKAQQEYIDGLLTKAKITILIKVD